MSAAIAGVLERINSFASIGQLDDDGDYDQGWGDTDQDNAPYAPK